MENRLPLLSNKVGFVFVLLYVLTLSGCAVTTPSQYYLLSPVKEKTETSVPDADKLHIIGVGPIKFPKYLNRSPIVRFSGENKVEVDEFNRWAEPLEQNFSHVMRINLTRLVASSYALEYPWKRMMKVQYQVILEVHQFGAQADNNVKLYAHWAILNLSKNKKIEIVRKFKYSQKLDTVNYQTIVAEQSRALGKLSQDIAKEMQRLMDR